jgi:hypothetical protein
MLIKLWNGYSDWSREIDMTEKDHVIHESYVGYSKSPEHEKQL